MNYFLNYKNGGLQILTYRAADAAVTDIADIKQACAEDREESLAASFEVEAYENGLKDPQHGWTASIKLPNIFELISQSGNSEESAIEAVLNYFIKYIKHSKIDSN